jgi:pilus assembly protein CpaE
MRAKRYERKSHRVGSEGEIHMSSHSILVKVKVNNASVGRQLEGIVRAIEGMQVQQPQDARRSDILILEVGNQLEKEFQLIHSLLNSNAVGEVFLTSTKVDPSILLQAMKAGTRHFFSQPLDEREIREALGAFKERTQGSDSKTPVRYGRIINILGSKGGVGTTTIAVNLAANLSGNKATGSVALVDMNTLFGEVPLFLGLKPVYHWGEVAKNIERLDATLLMSCLPRHSLGFHILPSPGSLNHHTAPTPDIMQRLLTLMKRVFDFVIVDGGQSVDANSLRVVELSDIVLVVSLLNVPCLSNTKKLLRSFSDSNVTSKDRIKLVINRYLGTSDISLKDAEEIIHKEIYWSIPNDYKTTMSAINQGKPVREISAAAPVTKSMEGLACALSGQETKQEEKETGWKLFKWRKTQS